MKGKSKKTYKRSLSIAGFDGSGGAGIQADLKTFSALGCYGMTVLTAIPVQNTQGVRSIYEIPLECIEEQIRAIFEDLGTDVVKIGMLHRSEIVELVVSLLKEYGPLDIVVDPVMVAKSGDRLLRSEAVLALKELLIPITTVLTPNIPEAEDLLDRRIVPEIEMEEAAREICEMGARAVVVKGGHGWGELSRDCLLNEGKVHWFDAKRIETKNTHGTGCTFSAAIAAFLAKGFGIVEAVEHAKKYLTDALRSGSEYQLGYGNGPVNHFYDVWR